VPAAEIAGAPRRKAVLELQVAKVAMLAAVETGAAAWNEARQVGAGRISRAGQSTNQS
jgi:hypothetical protein